MKFKFLSLMMAIAVALAFSACGDKGSSSSSDNSDSTSASGAASGEKKELTGDPAKDAQAAADEMLKLMETDIQTPEDADKLDKSMQELKNKYMELYKDNPEGLKKFQEEMEKINKSELGKKINDARGKLMQKVQDLKSKAQETTQEAQNAVSNTMEAIPSNAEEMKEKAEAAVAQELEEL